MKRFSRDGTSGIKPKLPFRTKIILLIIAIIIPLGGVNFYVLISFKHPIFSYQTMMDNIMAANDAMLLAKEITDKDLYDVLSNMDDANKRMELLDKIDNIYDRLTLLENTSSYANEIERLMILQRVLSSFADECVIAIDTATDRSMSERLDHYGNTVRIYSFFEDNIREYISLQITNRSNLNTDLKETLDLLLILSIILVSGLLAICAFIGVYISNRISKNISVEIKEREKAEEQLRHIVDRDTLTQLSSRYYFIQSLKNQIQVCHTTGCRMTLLFLDLDGFKEINDRFGHEKGDQVLKDTAARLLKVVRKNDIVSRFAGDEFAVLLVNVGTRKLIENICERIIAEIAKPFPLGNDTGHVTVSIGVTVYKSDMSGLSGKGGSTGDMSGLSGKSALSDTRTVASDDSGDQENGENADILLSKADTAMYHAKKTGKNTYRFHE